MSYHYEDMREKLFSDYGQRLFLKIRDRTHSLLRQAGSARMDCIIAGHTGDSWTMLACVDRMVELGELREVYQENVAGQHRVFVRA